MSVLGKTYGCIVICWLCTNHWGAHQIQVVNSCFEWRLQTILFNLLNYLEVATIFVRLPLGPNNVMHNKVLLLEYYDWQNMDIYPKLIVRD